MACKSCLKAPHTKSSFICIYLYFICSAIFLDGSVFRSVFIRWIQSSYIWKSGKCKCWLITVSVFVQRHANCLLKKTDLMIFNSVEIKLNICSRMHKYLFFPSEFHLFTHMWEILHNKSLTEIWGTKSWYFFMLLSYVAFSERGREWLILLIMLQVSQWPVLLSVIWMWGKKLKKV